MLVDVFSPSLISRSSVWGLILMFAFTGKSSAVYFLGLEKHKCKYV